MRKRQAKPIIDGIYRLIDEKYPLYVENNELGKGLAYLRDYKDNLYVYLNHVELTPDNNVCERTAKAFATGRNYVLNGIMSCRKAHLVAA